MCAYLLAFVYVRKGAFAILNGGLAVGNVIVIEVQTRLLYFERKCHVLAWEITHFSDSKSTLLVLFFTVMWTRTYSIDEVCNFPCQNMTVIRLK